MQVLPEVLLAVLEDAMQEREVLGVEIPLVALQVVALLEILHGGALPLRHAEKLIRGQQRRLAGTHIRQDQAAMIHAGVSRMADALVEGRSGGLAWLLETTPRHIVEPAVIDAAESAVLEPPVAQVSAAMGTVDAEEAGPAGVVAEE